MTSGGLANSKNALLFAGGVIVCAAIAASSLGNKFTPETGSQLVEASAQGGPGAQTAALENGAGDTAQSEESVFSDYEGYDDEADLIDDTSGFDPTPQDYDKDDSAFSASATAPSSPDARQAPSTPATGVGKTTAKGTGERATNSRAPRSRVGQTSSEPSARAKRRASVGVKDIEVIQ